MARKFIAALSGTYNVHANELAQSGSNNDTQTNSRLASGLGANLSAFINTRSIRAQPIQETIKCVVHFLDDTEHIFEIDRAAKGEELMELVFRHLELIEREYFALQFTEMFHHRRPTHFENNAVHNSTVYNKWLDPSKKVRKQMRFCSAPYLLHFRVKFYVSEMSRLLEEYTRYHFYLQLRKDIIVGRLNAEESVMATLASYVLQSELGDYCEENHKMGYSSQFRFIPNQTSEFEAKVESLHRLHQGQTPADSELNYLEEAKHLAMYGIDLHQAKDCDQQDILIGVSSNGLTIYKNQIKINTFSWAKIVKISFKRRLFFIQLKHEGLERYDNMIGFNLCSYRACKSLWKSCVEQHTFFRLHTPKPLTKKFFFFFSLGSKFRYSGKTEFQTIEENRKRLVRTERIFIRNNKKNATMPPLSSASKANNDAQKHILNLHLTSSNAVNGINSADDTKHNVYSSSTLPAPQQSLLASNISNCSKSASILTQYQSFSGQKELLSSHNNASLQKLASKLNILSQTKSDKSPTSSETSSSSSVSSHHHIAAKDDLINASSCDNIQLNGNTIIINIKTGNIEKESKFNSKSNQVCSIPTTSCATAYSPSTVISLPFIDQDKSTATSVTITNSLNDLRSLNNQSPKTLKSDDHSNSQLSNDFANLTDYVASNGHLSSNDLDVLNDKHRSTDEQILKQLSSESDVRSSTEVKLSVDSVNVSKINTESPTREWIKKLYEEAATNVPSVVMSDEESPQNPIIIRMKPDDDGRFGFNLKGGFDQNCPVLVSRVAANTPADTAYPIKLREGDQVLAINGLPVTGFAHYEVVELIRSTKNIGPDAELALTVRPNVLHQHCGDDDSIEEPPFQYTLAEPSSNYSLNDFSDCDRAKSAEPVNSPLDISMNLLQEVLENDSLLIQFNNLSRRNENESLAISRLIENYYKNRYLDISPYDSTRVILKESLTGDYINASYVTMEINNGEVVNRYIATQGPLKRTTCDFWQMAWEQKCSTIVMVTPLVEDGKNKCFKYWPEENETLLVNDQVELTLESCTDETAFLERRFKLTDTQANETHYVTHLQYLAWPDQGVPDDDADFLKLIFRLRALRFDKPDANVIVHCSAGIGRTGVLILMETGICLIETNQAIYPLELVRIMRNQRAMLIQTCSQFYFVCKALLHVYNDKIVTPKQQYLKHSS